MFFIKATLYICGSVIETVKTSWNEKNAYSRNIEAIITKPSKILRYQSTADAVPYYLANKSLETIYTLPKNNMLLSLLFLPLSLLLLYFCFVPNWKLQYINTYLRISK